MTIALRANTELVAVAWIGGVEGLTPGMVNVTLPKDNTGWAASGFVTVRAVGGSPGLYAPLRSPVCVCDCWAVSPNSAKPPWGLANHLAELIVAGCLATNAERTVTLPDSYPGARVLSAYPVSEPRRAYGDQGDYAHYVLDLALHWIDLS